MIELKGKYTTATIYAESVEEAVYSQVYDIINCRAFEGQKVVLMPDTHSGKSGPCGLVATIGKYVCPEQVGCLDKDTEVLTPQGWIKISEYQNQRILQYDPSTDTACFILPKQYIKEPCKEFYHFYSKDNTLDQMLSEEHKMLVFRKGARHVIKPLLVNPEFFNSVKNIEQGYYTFKASFNTSEKGINIPDELIRVDVMVQADGYISRWRDGSKNTVRLHLRRERKIQRARDLLNISGINFSEVINKDGSTTIKFYVPAWINKDLTRYFLASKEQLRVVADECLFWDGHQGYRSYYVSKNRQNADVIQFAFTATDTRASMYLPPHKPTHNQCYSVIPTKNRFVGYTKYPQKVESLDGFKYCFSTDTGFFVCRRNNYVFITGNCDVGCTVSMMVLDKKIPAEKYAEFEHRVKKLVPFGVNLQERTIIDERDFRRFLTAGFNKYRNLWPEMLFNLPDQVTEKWISEQLKRIGIDEAVFYKSLGTVGGGEVI